jgi:hypothetical protein
MMTMTIIAPWLLQELADYGHTNNSNIILMVSSKTSALWSRMINLRHLLPVV